MVRCCENNVIVNQRSPTLVKLQRFRDLNLNLGSLLNPLTSTVGTTSSHFRIAQTWGLSPNLASPARARGKRNSTSGSCSGARYMNMTMTLGILNIESSKTVEEISCSVSHQGSNWNPWSWWKPEQVLCHNWPATNSTACHSLGLIFLVYTSVLAAFLFFLPIKSTLYQYLMERFPNWINGQILLT